MRFDGRVLDWTWSPSEVLRRWRPDRRVVMLHSGRFDKQWARYSILAEPVGTYRFDTDVGSAMGGNGNEAPGEVSRGGPGGPGSGRTFRSQWSGHGRPCPVGGFIDHPFGDLRALLAATQGLWIGYLGYDMARWVEPRLRGIVGRDDWPVIELGYCPGYLVHDGLTGTWWACGEWRQSPPELLSPAPPIDGVGLVAGELVSNFSRQGYLEAVLRIKEAICAGEVYQVNLAQRLTAPFEVFGPGPVAGEDAERVAAAVIERGAVRGFYSRLSGVSPAWFGAYLELSCGGRAVVSASPELFLRVDHGEVVTRPVKGTRPSSAPEGELRHSVKDKAELNMIVDLMRNDLGRVCAYGSVKVVEPRAIEAHPTVRHAAATITGTLHGSKDVVDLLRATLPGGSVTGAPKIRAMELISEIEPVGRGPYCGCIGYLSKESVCLSVAIRTVLIDAASRRLDFSVGGGVVADSDPESEYRETLDKAAAIMEALNAAEPASRVP